MVHFSLNPFSIRFEGALSAVCFLVAELVVLVGVLLLRPV